MTSLTNLQDGMNGIYTPVRPKNRSDPQDRGEIIQRLIIVHWKLAELSLGQALSDGDASDAVAGEEILYSYSSRPLDTSQQKDVSFVGLCQALYTLPDAVQDLEVSSSHEGNMSSSSSCEPTQEVILDKSIITFVPLESPAIVALLQTNRQTTPSAVRAAVTRSHEIFCLLRGGGIHRRMLQNTSSFQLTEMQYGRGCRYPGMDMLYQLRKRQDKIMMTRETDEDSKNERVQVFQDKIDELNARLPVSTLRRDLRVHYDAFVGELEQQADACRGSVLRSMVEEMPKPVSRADGSQAYYSSPRSLSEKRTTSILHTLSSFLESKASLVPCQKNPGEASILGVSFFFEESLIRTFASHKGDFSVPGETASLLLSYMDSVRYQMPCSRNRSENSSGHSTPTRPSTGFPQLVLSLGNRLEGNSLADTEHMSEDGPHFLSPPPLSQLSALDEITSLVGPTDGFPVWGLPISLQSRNQRRTCQDGVDQEAVMSSLFLCGDVKILLYLSIPVDELGEYDDRCCINLFRDFVNSLSPVLHMHFCVPASDGDEPLPDSGDKLLQLGRRYGPGVEIIFADWAERRLYLFTKESHQSVGGEATQRPNLVNMFTPKKKKKSIADNTQIQGRARFDGSGMLSLGMDCRHLLLTHLSLDVQLALEGAMGEMKASTNIDYPVETCTFLSQKWVYAYTADDGQELYLIFDAKIYVTLGDVQDCARCIREELFTRH